MSYQREGNKENLNVFWQSESFQCYFEAFDNHTGVWSRKKKVMLRAHLKDWCLTGPGLLDTVYQTSQNGWSIYCCNQDYLYYFIAFHRFDAAYMENSCNLICCHLLSFAELGAEMWAEMKWHPKQHLVTTQHKVRGCGRLYRSWAKPNVLVQQTWLHVVISCALSLHGVVVEGVIILCQRNANVCVHKRHNIQTQLKAQTSVSQCLC